MCVVGSGCRQGYGQEECILQAIFSPVDCTRETANTRLDWTRIYDFQHRHVQRDPWSSSFHVMYG